MRNTYEEVVRVTLDDRVTGAARGIGRVLDGVQRQFQQFSARGWSVRLGVIDNLSSGVRNAMATAQRVVGGGLTLPIRLAGGAMGALNTIGMAGFGLQSIAMAAQGASSALGIGLNSTMEQTQAQFMAFTKDAGKTADILDLIEKRAALTPFQFQEMASTAASLLPIVKSTGMGLEDLMKTAEILAASNPMQGLEGASFSLREALTGDFVSITDRFNLSRSSINKWKAQGVSNIEIVRRAMAEMGYDAELVSRMGQTLSGRWSTFTDSLDRLRRQASAPIFQRISDGLVDLQKLFDENQDTIADWGKTIGKNLGDAMDTVGRFGNMARAVFLAFTKDKGAIGIVYNEIQRVFGKGVADFVQPALQRFMDFIPTLQRVGRWVEFAFGAFARGEWRSGMLDLAAGFRELTGIDVTGFVEKMAQLGTVLSHVWSLITTEDKQTAIGNLVGSFKELTGVDITGLVEGIQKFSQFVFDVYTIAKEPVLANLAAAFTNIKDAVVALVPLLNPFREGMGGYATEVDRAKTPTRETADSLIAMSQAIKDMTALLGPFVEALKAVEVTLNNINSGSQAISKWLGGGKVGPEGPVSGIGPRLQQEWEQRAGAAGAGGGIPGAGLGNVLGNALADIFTDRDRQRRIEEASKALGQNATVGVAQGVEQGTPEVSAAGEGAGQAIIDGAADALQAESPSRAMAAIGMDAIRGLIVGMGSVDLMGWIRTHITEAIPDYMRQALGISSPSTVMAAIGVQMMDGFISGLRQRIPDVQAITSSISGMFGAVGGDVGGWIQQAIQATGVPAAWAAGLATIIQHESGGNPAAANMWDINAQRGDPSVGLMQLTGSNRATYTPGGMDPMDPVAQIIAGIRYIQARYGDIGSVPGVASMAAGGPYRPYDEGGWLMPGRTLAVNNTGRPELVLPPGKLGGGVNISGVTINLNVGGGDVAALRAALPAVADELLGIVGTRLDAAWGNMAA